MLQQRPSDIAAFVRQRGHDVPADQMADFWHYMRAAHAVATKAPISSIVVEENCCGQFLGMFDLFYRTQQIDLRERIVQAGAIWLKRKRGECQGWDDKHWGWNQMSSLLEQQKQEEHAQRPAKAEAQRQRCEAELAKAHRIKQERIRQEEERRRQEEERQRRDKRLREIARQAEARWQEAFNETTENLIRSVVAVSGQRHATIRFVHEAIDTTFAIEGPIHPASALTQAAEVLEHLAGNTQEGSWLSVMALRLLDRADTLL